MISFSSKTQFPQSAYRLPIPESTTLNRKPNMKRDHAIAARARLSSTAREPHLKQTLQLTRIASLPYVNDERSKIVLEQRGPTPHTTLSLNRRRPTKAPPRAA